MILIESKTAYRCQEWSFQTINTVVGVFICFPFIIISSHKALGDICMKKIYAYPRPFNGIFRILKSEITPEKARSISTLFTQESNLFGSFVSVFLFRTETEYWIKHSFNW